MDFDPVVANPARLAILSALVGQDHREFVHLRCLTRLTDGNLCTHARKLLSAGLIRVGKSLRDGRPVTTFAITPAGRDALKNHVRQLMAALEPAEPTSATTEPEPVAVSSDDDEWID